MEAIIESAFAVYLKSMGWEGIPVNETDSIKIVFLSGMLTGCLYGGDYKDTVEAELKATALRMDKACKEDSNHE